MLFFISGEVLNARKNTCIAKLKLTKMNYEINNNMGPVGLFDCFRGIGGFPAPNLVAGNAWSEVYEFTRILREPSKLKYVSLSSASSNDTSERPEAMQLAISSPRKIRAKISP